MKKDPCKPSATELNTETEAALLGKIHLFSSLSREEIASIRSRITIRRFKKNQVILREQDANHFMYIILYGEARVTRSSESGKEMLLAIHCSGDSFGELAMIDGKNMPSTVSAARDSIVAIISRPDFYSLISSNQKINDNLLLTLCTHLRHSFRLIEILNFNNADQRLKMLFVTLSERHGNKTAHGMHLDIKLTHREISEMSGLTRETVTKIIDRWRKENKIHISPDKSIVLKSSFYDFDPGLL